MAQGFKVPSTVTLLWSIYSEKESPKNQQDQNLTWNMTNLYLRDTAINSNSSLVDLPSYQEFLFVCFETLQIKIMWNAFNLYSIPINHE